MPRLTKVFADWPFLVFGLYIGLVAAEPGMYGSACFTYVVYPMT